MKYLIPVILILSVFTITGCKKSVGNGGGGAGGGPTPSSKAITSFIFRAADNSAISTDVVGVIGADTIILSVPNGTIMTNLVPTIQHSGSSVSPGSGTGRDFSSPVIYTVTAADNSTHNYVAVVRPIINNTVYVGSTDGKLYALNGDNGTVKWTYTTGGAINNGSPTYYNGTVYFGSADSYLYALDASTGTLKWRYQSLGDLGYTTPVVYNGNLYFGGLRSVGTYPYNYTYVVNAQTGTLIWSRAEGAFSGSLSVYNDMIFIGTFNGLYSLAASTGTGLVNFASSNICGDNPMLVNGVLYSGTEIRILTAYNATTGAVIWDYHDGSGINYGGATKCGPTMQNGIIYNGVFDQMYAMDSATGLKRWIYSAGTGQWFSPPSVANNTVYAGSVDNTVYAIDAYLGTLKWKYNTLSLFGAIANNVTPAGSLVYFGSTDKNIYCLNALNGSLRWKFLTNGYVYGGPCVVTDNGFVYHPGISGEHQ